MNGNLPLQSRVRRLSRRLLSIGLAAGTIWGLAAATLLFLVGAWLDLLWEFTPEWRIATLWAAGVSGGLLLIALAAATVRSARDYLAARRLDHAAEAGGRIYTGWELEQNRFGLAGREPDPLSAGMATIAASKADAEAKQVPLRKAAPLRPFTRSLTAVGLLVVLVSILVLAMPGMALTQWKRFTSPHDDVPPFSLTTFDVTPGTTEVIYGGDLEICATTSGAPVEQVELVLVSKRGEQPLPMFPEADGRWRAALTNITQPTDYFVRSYRARSVKYNIGVITVPLIENVKVRIEQPDYVNRAAYVGPLPKDGVSGLLGTKVQITLGSNRRLSGGEITLTGKSGSKTVAMNPSGSSDGREAVGEFTVEEDGKFECRVIDVADQKSQQTVVGNVILLLDTRPFIRVTHPPKTSLATPTAALPVMLSAEDDCGIARVEFYRSLNDSRPLPTDLKLPDGLKTRLDLPTELPLHQYGLVPGDVIKIFGRVEDNDPTGAKGAESTIAVVRIISEEEYQRLMQESEGIDAMMSKYDAARRRMEHIAEELEKLQKEIEKLPPDEKIDEQTLAKLNKLREMMRQEAEAIRKSTKFQLPLDLDKYLTPELTKMAKMTEEMADALKKLAEQREMINKKLGGKLDEMAKKLAEARGEYQQNVSEPLEYLESVLPLMADQSRFVMIVLWQRDLAERMAALKGHDNDDDPKLKARMRDLEQEQRQVGEALIELLDDIEENAKALPDDPELDELRDTALDFVQRVRASGASEAIEASAAALAEFKGTKAHEKAKEAAEILESFLNECENCGKSASSGCKLKFSPSLCNSMGMSIEQILASMKSGAGMGSGMGMGYGAGGGFGGVGLFGGLPAMFGIDRPGGEGRDSRLQMSRSGRGAAPAADNPDDSSGTDTDVSGRSSGMDESAVPIRYRRQVGEYFERIAEETGETK